MQNTVSERQALANAVVVDGLTMGALPNRAKLCGNFNFQGQSQAALKAFMASITASATVIHTGSVLGKRKARYQASYVLHLSSSPEPWCTQSDSDFDDVAQQKPPMGLPILVNGTLVPNTKKRYQCTYDGCMKSYSKPSRLEEHERSHTGQRPFVCGTCNKSYLRETHLQAHARSHLPESARPLACPRDNCGKRFWTAQHLRVHTDWHNGSKPFQCSKPGCDESFSKNHQLRAHECSAHAAPGTKPYRCEHEGCTKSFNTNQHLHTHSKVHDEHRYTCVHLACLAESGKTSTYYPTWTALQHHIRTAHPPQCSHPSCNGRTFSSQKGLRAHQKLHEQRELEQDMGIGIVSDGEDDDDGPPRKRRRGGEIGRDWKCDVDGCDKDFKSKKALATHANVTHLGRRDHVCPHDGCGRAYGYKHLLHRHLAKAHASATSAPPSSDEEGGSTGKSNVRQAGKSKPSTLLDIETMTGNSYAKRTRAKVANATALLCPYPLVDALAFVTSDDLLATVKGDTSTEMCLDSQQPCEYAFSRAYDLRRHLKAVHGLDAVKESVDDWVREHKSG
ncbi:Transcription factor IIIA [Hypsizygus marmoreus]|uniref:Transcription factor IIIA n=1 Tax=Hypsizygus marmoreus TaxID=39966 RepID=A0A369JVD4_HYPMA|nr:Transcription factor IIIA [Hypsizygus marmoreus]